MVETDALAFDNPFKDLSREARDHVTGQLKLKISRVMAIVRRDEDAAERRRSKDRKTSVSLPSSSGTSEGVIAALRHTYEGPGSERALGCVDQHFLTVVPADARRRIT